MKAIISPRITTANRTPLQDVIPLSTPYLIFLDPCNLCNQQCSFCPTGNRKLVKNIRNNRLLDFELYKKIIDDLAAMPEPIKVLRLYKDGEPLMHSKLPDMISYAKNTGRFNQVDTTTNGTLLSPRLSKKLVIAGLDKIFISVPPYYSPRYVMEVRLLYSFSRELTKIYVKAVGDYMTQDQQKKFYDDFGDICDSIFLEHIAPCWPEYKVEGANKEKGIYGQEIKEVMCCPYIFYSLAINSDGTVSLCFLDWRHDMIIGDLKKESFKDIWNGERLRFEQSFHLAGLRKSEISLESCRRCGQLSYGAPDDIDQYAEEIARRTEYDWPTKS